MLHLTLAKGEYVVIDNNIKISYDENTGKAVVDFGVEAPSDVAIIQSQKYEDNLAQKAAEGDRSAMRQLEELIAENIKRREIFGKRRAKRQYIGGQKARAAAR